MAPEESKSYQLRVRVTAEERDLLEKLRIERNRGETISDLVREALALLTRPGEGSPTPGLSEGARARISHLAGLLKREPHQVEEACVDGIMDLIDRRCEVPLIVMETYLHLKYHGRDEPSDAPKNGHSEIDPKLEAKPETAPRPPTPALEKSALKS